MILLRVLVCLGFLLSPSLTANNELPPLKVTAWLQAPSGFSGEWSTLRGKVVVVEFWATWCSPCVSALPHLNQLAEEFQNEDVLFLAISEDDPKRLEGFLAGQSVRAIIGIDADRKTWNAFDVPSIPHTVIIDAKGRLIGATTPEQLSAERLRRVLAGETAKFPPKEGIRCDLQWDEDSIEWQDGVRPTTYAIIKPIKTTMGGYLPQPGHLTADGVPLRTLVQIAYQTDPFHIEWNLPRDDRTYRAAFRVPSGREQRLFPLIRQTLADAFGFRARWEERLHEVRVLRRIEGGSIVPESRADEDLVQVMKGRITLRRQPVSRLCQILTQHGLGAIVIDETGMNGLYDFDLPYQPGQPEVTLGALNEVGLEAVDARRTIRILVVDRQ
jgi:uncharacterized protein (TIGR03435 family)